MAHVPTPPGTLERQLMRKSVSALEEDRPRCHDCRRTPLLGEEVFLYGDRPVCELCRPRHRDEPSRRVPVRGWEHGSNVRPTARAAA